MWALRKKECHQYLMTKINYFLLWNRGREVKNSCGKLRTMLLILKIKKRLKNFLKVQWLRRCLPVKGVQVWSLVRKIIGEGNGTPLQYFFFFFSHSSTLAWKIPWMEKPGRLQSMGSLRVRHNWASSLSRIGEGNGNPLQCSCLENPRDEEPGGLPSMGLHRVGHDWSDLAAAAVGR